ncbi:MAG: tetratricopeptide repeat protein, partial [Pyrinomonadaceae bacterium]
LYVSLGNEPGIIGESYVRFRELLTKQQPQGFEWLAQQMLDEDHGSVVLRSHYEGLRKIYEGWRPQVDTTTGALIGGFSKIDAHYKWLSQKFGYSIQPTEAIINLFGYQFMNARMMDDAIAAFKMNVERFPASANVYDSLGEAYERSGKIDLARTNYEKAYTIAKERNDPNVALFKANLDRASAPVNETK